MLQERRQSGYGNSSHSCQVLTSGRLLVEKDRDGEFSGRGRKWIAVAHGGELVGGAHEDPDRLAPCEPRDAARSEVRKRMIAQTRFRFLRAAWKASRRSPSGAAMRFAESRAAVVSEQVLLRPRATVPPSQ
jgi:hypothetical protein